MIPVLSSPEILVYNWLTRRKIAFIPQQNMYGGTTEAGGARVDYWLVELNIIIRIQSYWHTDPKTEAKDIIQKTAMINDGFQVVDVWEEDLKANLEETMRKALQGIEITH